MQEKEFIVQFTCDYFIFPKKNHQKYLNIMAGELVVDPITGQLTKINVPLECLEIFHKNKDFLAVKDRNEWIVYHYNDPLLSVRLPINSQYLKSVTEKQTIPEKFKDFSENCWAVCTDDTPTSGKDEQLVRNKLYQLNGIRVNNRTGKTTAQVIDSKFRWSLDRFTPVNDWENLASKTYINIIKENYNQKLKDLVTSLENKISKNTSDNATKRILKQELYTIFHNILKK